MLRFAQTELELERASAGISPAPIKLNLFEAKKRYIDLIVSQHKGKESEIYRLGRNNEEVWSK